MARTNELTNLYTLIIKSNQDFEIRVNGQVAKAGNLYKNQNYLIHHLNHQKRFLMLMIKT